MAKAPLMAVDFLGLGRMQCGRDVEMSGEDESTKLIKPTASLPTFPGRGCWPMAIDGLATPAEPCLDSQEQRCQQSTPCRENQQVSDPSRGMTGFAGGRGDEMKGDRASVKPSAGSERTLLDKPLEELTVEDIQQLTREDCRRYLKERGMRRPSWNKSQAIQQVLSLKGLFDSKSEDERRPLRCGSKKDPAERTTMEPSEPSNMQQVSPAHIQQPLPPQIQCGLPSQVQQALISSRKQPVAPRSQLPLSSYGYQVRSSPNDIAGRVHESGSSSGWVPSRQGSMDAHLVRQLSQTSQSPNPAGQLTGFVPSLSSIIRFSRSLPASICPPESMLSMAVQQVDEGHLPLQGLHPQQAPVGIGASNLSVNQPTAQLTIFYSGLVNVYDDVPADKAQAIMLLAASGNSWSACSLNPHVMGNIAANSACAAPFNAPAHTSGVVAAPYNLNIVGVPISAALAPVISPLPKQQSTVPAEHPPSRQASLQRFLEKRKDRVRTKAPYTARKLVSDNHSPLDASCHIKIHGRSSVTSVPPQLPMMAPGQRPTQSSGSETSSPTKLPQTLQQRNSEEQGSLAEKGPPSDKHTLEEKPCEMELSSPSQQNSS